MLKLLIYNFNIATYSKQIEKREKIILIKKFSIFQALYYFHKIQVCSSIISL